MLEINCDIINAAKRILTKRSETWKLAADKDPIEMKRS
jgi:hypothetical protein